MSLFVKRVLFVVVVMVIAAPVYAQNFIGAPALVSPANGATGVSTSVMLTWQKDAIATSYLVQCASDSTFTTNLEQTGTSSGQFSPTGLVAGTTYYWRVKEFVNSMSGAFSEIWSFTTAAPVLTAPVPITPDDFSHNLDTALWFSWTRSANAASYHFQTAYDQNFISGKRDTTVSDTTVYITALYHNSTYFWRVQSAGDGGAASSYFEIRTFTTNAQTDAVPLESSDRPVGILADPFGATLDVSVSLEAPSAVTFSFYDLLGREAMNITEGVPSGKQRLSIDANALPEGAYILVVKSGNVVNRFRVVHLR